MITVLWLFEVNPNNYNVHDHDVNVKDMQFSLILVVCAQMLYNRNMNS